MAFKLGLTEHASLSQSVHVYSNAVPDRTLTQTTPRDETSAASTADEMSARHEHDPDVCFEANLARLGCFQTLVFDLDVPRQSFPAAAACQRSSYSGESKFPPEKQ